METIIWPHILFLAKVTLVTDQLTPNSIPYKTFSQANIVQTFNQIGHSLLKVSSGNHHMTKNSIFSNGDLGNWPIDPKLNPTQDLLTS